MAERWHGAAAGVCGSSEMGRQGGGLEFSISSRKKVFKSSVSN